MAVEVASLRVQPELSKNDAALLVGAQSGVKLQLLVRSPSNTIVSVDEQESSIESLKDDKGTDLKAADATLRSLDISSDHHTAAIEIAAPLVPSKDASSLVLSGSLQLKTAGGEKSADAKHVIVRPDSHFRAGPYAMSISEMKTVDLAPGMKLGITLLFTGEPDAIKAITFLDSKGQTIESRATTTTVTRAGKLAKVMKQYELSQTPETMTVHVEYYDDIRSIAVPVKLQTGLGL
jgi:hypothetical protein